MQDRPTPPPHVALLVEPRILSDMLAHLLRATGAEVLVDQRHGPVDIVVATAHGLRRWRGHDVPIVMVAEDRSPPGPTITGTHGTVVHDLDAVLAAVDAVSTSG